MLQVLCFLQLSVNQWVIGFLNHRFSLHYYDCPKRESKGISVFSLAGTHTHSRLSNTPSGLSLSARAIDLVQPIKRRRLVPDRWLRLGWGGMRTAGEEESYWRRSTSWPTESFYLVFLSKASHPEITLNVPNASIALPGGIHLNKKISHCSITLLIKLVHSF